MVTSRFVRILASTDVRWIGSAEKCFRFEIIGCDPEQIIPEINFEATSKPAGNFCLKLLRYVMYVINSKLRVETQSKYKTSMFCQQFHLFWGFIDERFPNFIMKTDG